MNSPSIEGKWWGERKSGTGGNSEWRKGLRQFRQRLKAKWMFHLGVFLLRKGNYRGAVELLQRASQVLKEDPFTQVHLGWAYWYLGHPALARKHLIRVAELFPDNPVFTMMAGKLAALSGKWDEAERLLRKTVNLAPRNIVAQSWLALVLLRKGQTDEALDILSRIPVADDLYLQANLALQLELLAMQRGERSRISLPFLPKWFKMPLLNSVLGFLLRWRGERLLEDGEWEAAVKWIGMAAQLRPKDLDTKLLLAIALLEGGFWSQAEKVLREIPETVPERAWVYGALLVRQRRIGEALRWLDKTNTQHPFVRYYLALALASVGDESACITHLESLYREDPSSLRQRIHELLKWLRHKQTQDSAETSG